MKKLLQLSTLGLTFALFSCSKNAADITPQHTTTTPEVNVIGSGSGGSGTGTTESFNGNFKIVAQDPMNIFEKQPITLINSSPNVEKYVWLLGNGTKSTEKNPTINYSWHGNYHVQLTVFDHDGKSATSSQNISILCNFTH